METSSSAKSGLRFCPICGKPFTQETSHTRHVQYCRRRAATKRTGPARTRACRHCRTTKSKCDAQLPCSRCVRRQKECVYDKPWQAPDATATAAPGPVAEPAAGPALATESRGSSGSTSGSDSTTPSTTSGSPGQADGTSCYIGLPDAQPFTTSATSMAQAVSPTTLAATLSSAPLTMSATASAPSIDPAFCLPNFMFSPRMSNYGFDRFSFSGLGAMDMSMPPLVPASLAPSMSLSMPSPIRLHMPYATPPNPVIELSEAQAGRGASPELRRLIVSMVRTFPRMMTRPENLPPFVHRVGCGLHYEEVQRKGMVLPEMPSSGSSSLVFIPNEIADDTTLFQPLPLMAACVGISHAFVTRSPHSDEFLWRAIDKEQQAIVQGMNSLSFGEIFASIQAVAIYTTMRLIVYGREYFYSDTSLLDTMSKLSERFHHLWRGPFMPTMAEDDDIDLNRPNCRKWEDWIFDETRRRIMATCWLMSLAVNPRAQSFRLSNPQRFPLPSSRRLWEAETREAWERAYDNDRIERYHLRRLKSDSRKLETVGDLARAIDRSVAAEGSLGQPNIDALYEDQLLAHWHAGVDSLGMMITAAAAQYTFD